jgi:hypothetical protein
MLNEPEHGVRDDAVEEAIRVGVVGHEPQPERRARGRALRAGPARGNVPLDVGHRARDPGDVEAVDQGSQRRHEPAAPPDALERAARAAAESERAAVRDDDDRLLVACHPGYGVRDGRSASVTSTVSRLVPRITVKGTV